MANGGMDRRNFPLSSIGHHPLLDLLNILNLTLSNNFSILILVITSLSSSLSSSTYSISRFSPSEALKAFRKQLHLVSCDSNVAEIGGHSKMGMVLGADFPDDLKRVIERFVSLIIILQDERQESLASSFQPWTCLWKKTLKR